MNKIFILFFLLFTTNLFSKDQKVYIQFQWKHQFEYAGFYAAKEKGYYKSYGLDVDFLEYSNGINITDKVLNTPHMYGISYSNIFYEFAQGKPIFLLANFFKKSPLVLVTQKKYHFTKRFKT